MNVGKRRITKAFSVVLILSFIVANLLGCGNQEDNAKEELSAPINIATLNGPTGIGMIQLIEHPEKYQITMYQSPDEIVGKVITGEVDIAAVPSNLAGVLYQKTQGQIMGLGINTLGVLYVMENGNSITKVDQLKGKTIIASGKGGAPEYILASLLTKAGIDPEQDVTMEWLANHTDVTSAFMAKEGSIALLPEPFVTVVTNKSSNIEIAIDLNQAWVQEYSEEEPQDDKYTLELPMGVLIGQKSFVEERQGDLEVFMEDYHASVNYVNTETDKAAELVEKHGILPDKKIAQQAIPRCNIRLYPFDHLDAQIMLEKFYEEIYTLEPKSIGGQIPDEGFYYNPEK